MLTDYQIKEIKKICKGEILASAPDVLHLISLLDNLWSSYEGLQESCRAMTEVAIGRMSPQTYHKMVTDSDRFEKERDTYRAMICDLLASAHPHPKEHPTMTRQWARARELLKNGPAT